MYIKRYMIKDMWGLFCAKAFQFQSIKTANPKKINENQVSFDSIFLMFRWNLRVHCIVLYLLNHDILAKPQPVSVNINNAGKKS